MKYSELVAREGLVFILPLWVLTIVLWYINWMVSAAVFAILTLFCIYFFRNPHRIIPSGEDIVISPADGKVMYITPATPDEYCDEEMIKVSIFLNIFNVHINRVPISGQVDFLKSTTGLYLSAYKPEVSEKNTRKYLGLMTHWGKILVVQISGLVARRIVNRAQMGEFFQSGDRFGLIRFGSCTELYLPKNCEIKVVPGQKVKGGETVIAKLL